MFKAFFTFLGRLYFLIFSIILSVIIGVAAWCSWELYLDEKLANRFLKEGHLMEVKVEEVSTEQQSWRDYLANTVYLTFHYNHQTYKARFIIDTLYVATGDSVSLLYHPQLNTFRQAKQQFHFNQSQTSSRLIKWSVINTFSDETRWLVLCLTLSAFFFLYSFGALVSITGWSFLQPIGRFVGSMLLVGASLFFSYDCWQYYQYYQHIKTNGREIKVKIINTDRSSYSSRQGRYWKWYLYTAKVQFQGRERIIPLQESDYQQLKPGGQLLVLYDDILDDMIPVDYPIDYRQFLLVIFFWLISLFAIYQLIHPKKTAKVKKFKGRI